MRIARWLVGLVALGMLALPVPDLRAAPPTPGAWDLVEAINDERFTAGLPPLAVLVNILDMADKQATAIADAGRLFHNETLADDLAARVPGWMRVGENVGYATSIAAVHAAFMGSPPHRANILGDFNYVAVTVVQRGDTLWVAEVFAKAPPGRDTLTRVPVTRIGDPANVAGSIAASRSMFAAGGSNGVVIARQDVFADALAGGALAAVRGGPVLLSSRDQAAPELVTEAKRALAPGGTVYLMGGTGALSEAVESAVRGAGMTVQRIAGANRFETAALAASAINESPTTILVTSGLSFADAMSVAPAAAALHAPIILANGNDLPLESTTYLAQHPTASRIVVGGTASVGDAAAAAALSTERVAGADRFETSVAVARRWFGASDRLVVVTGSTFQDAAVGGPMAARLGGPVVMTASLPTSSTYAFFRDRLRSLRDIRIIGTADEVTPPTVSLLFS